MKSTEIAFSNSILSEFELGYFLTNQASIIKNLDQNNNLFEGKSIIGEIQRIKSPNSINQIFKLQENLSNLENKCSVYIAEKYLNGFLESKGVKSFTEYIEGLH